ncbi:MAG: hypothetical protein A3F78_07290 [Burkholderiales bacterium RIFCSPLOWO2_12_FULL_61_40]|nr:MAG: hypothetical protein A3F78_07290 [Burkholderiales bacterium RIFCSPLOWO2_12_FULL_61_40]
MRKIDPERQQSKRQHILDAAVRCFIRSGFHQTRTAEICREAHMSPGNLFHYFDSKEAIIAAVVVEGPNELGALLERASSAPDLFAALLEAIDQQLALLTQSAYTRLSLEAIAEAVRNPAVFAAVSAHEADKKTALVRLLQMGVERQHLALHTPAPRAADWILLLLDGAFGRAMVETDFDLVGYRHLVHSALSQVLAPARAAAGGSAT